MPASPCIAVCRLDPATGLCIGCGRSIDEIARWPDLDEDERRRIVERLHVERLHVERLHVERLRAAPPPGRAAKRD